MSNHPDLEFILNETQWLQWHEFKSSSGNHTIEALAYVGLFTDYLAALSQGKVAVELVRQGQIDDKNPDSITRRDVIIRVGEKTAAIASTLIEPDVIQRYPWLNELGGKAIGETLEHRLGAVRADVCYRSVPNNAQNAGIRSHFGGSESRLWGRRYRYLFEGGGLCITEVIAGSVIVDITGVAGAAH